jgi:hypothetical protein
MNRQEAFRLEGAPETLKEGFEYIAESIVLSFK